LFYCICFNAVGQGNLVPNPSFELLISCPDNLSQLEKVENWYSKLLTTPDFYNTCALTSNVSVPQNWQGYEPAFDGQGYVGIYAYLDAGGDEWMEYIKCELKQTLISGECYSVSFYASLSDTSCVAINNLGIGFDKDAAVDSIATYYVPDQIMQYDTLVDNVTGWKKISFTYTAQGNEKYLLIGNFNNNASTDFTQITGCLNLFAYYYIDQVELKKCNSEITFVPNVFTPNGDGINDYVDFTAFNGSEIQIINRWGENVLMMNNQSNYLWFGKNDKGQELSSGVYYYIIYDLIQNKTGLIHLVR